MVRTPQAFRIVLLVATTWLGLCFTPDQVGAREQQRESSLRVRSAIRTRRDGNTVLVLKVGNYGERTVNVGSISAWSNGGWSMVGRDIQAGAVLNWVMVLDHEPAFIWLDTSEGRFRFDIVPGP